MDLVVSEMCDHPEENNGVILGDFFFLARGSGCFSLGNAFDKF